MADTATQIDAPTIEARVNYLIRTSDKPVNETYGPGPGGLMRKTSGTYDRRIVPIDDGRGRGFGLESAGFELVDHTTQMRNFFDPDELTNLYYAEMRQLIAERSGARRVHIFDHTLRTSDEADRTAKQIREPVRSVHNDYTDWSGPQRLRDILPDDAEALLTKRMAIIQVWRAIDQPVERDPLAIVDGRTIAPGDLIPAERRFPDRVGEIYQFEYNPAHRWFYFPRMRRDEALVFKVYDSDKARVRWGAHSSFELPDTPADAPARESIEIRAFAFF